MPDDTTVFADQRARIAELEAAIKQALNVIDGMAASERDHCDSGVEDPQEQCFGGFPVFGTVTSRFGEDSAVIGWPDLALARDKLAQALQVGGP